MAPIIQKIQMATCLAKHGFAEEEDSQDLEGNRLYQFKRKGAIPIVILYNPISGKFNMYEHMPSPLTSYIRGFVPKKTRDIDFMLTLFF